MDQLDLKIIFSAYRDCYITARHDPKKLNVLSVLDKVNIEAALRKDSKIACAKNCSHCCYLRVVAYPHELVAIHNYIHHSLKLDVKQTILERLKSQAKIVENMSEQEHLTTNIVCPFLLNKQCVIYAVRPITCAGYHSLSEAACVRSYDNPTDTNGFGIPLSQDIDRARNIQHQLVVGVSRSLESDEMTYELITSLQKIENNPKAIQRWKQSKKMFR
jgi:Fe-S-cluster containining protein